MSKAADRLPPDSEPNVSFQWDILHIYTHVTLVGECSYQTHHHNSCWQIGVFIATSYINSSDTLKSGKCIKRSTSQGLEEISTCPTLKVNITYFTDVGSLEICWIVFKERVIIFSIHLSRIPHTLLLPALRFCSAKTDSTFCRGLYPTQTPLSGSQRLLCASNLSSQWHD